MKLIAPALLFGIMVAFAAMSIVGCSSTPTTLYVPQEVKVPVPVPCDVSKLDLGSAPIDRVLSLPEVSTPAQRQSAVLQDLEDYRQYTKLLEIGLQSCAKPI